MTTTDEDGPDATPGPQPTAEPAPHHSVFERWGHRGTIVVFSLAALVLLLIGATIGLVLGGSQDSDLPDTMIRPAADSVDVGFCRDMSTHHEQGVLMAHIIQGIGSDADTRTMAYDIEYTQTSQIGQMGGFLQLWDYSLNSTDAPMSWMGGSDGHDMAGMSMTVDPSAAAQGAIMPGMATNDEIAHLQSLSGTEADIYFLQLMIRHHEGGTPMMVYAAEHATNPVVRNMAQKMADAQTKEVVVMTQMLQEMGAAPLPFPDSGSTTIVAPSGTGTSNGGTSGATTGMTDMPGMSGLDHGDQSTAAPTS